jgi:DNA invertase Pin-like site-specific DNA recombinase
MCAKPIADIYCRISDDRRGGAGLGVKRQEKDGRELARQRDLNVGEVHVDNDIGAYHRTERPGYRALLDRVRSGAVQAVIVWHPDRLHRRMDELEEFIDIVERARCRVEAVRAGEIDLSVPSGRLVARLLGAAARYESEHKAERIRSKHVELATAGQWAGGARPYGYQRDGREFSEPITYCRLSDRVECGLWEAGIIKDAAKRALTGETLGAICRDLNAREIPGGRGRSWTVATLRRILVSARISGRRERRVAEDGKGQVVVGTIVSETSTSPAIISVAQSDELRRMFGGNGRGRRGVHVLAGLACCALCGTVLISSAARGRRELTCPKKAGRPGCGRIRVLAAPVEERVEGDVLEAIDGGQLAALLAGPEPGARDLDAELVAVQERLRQLGRDLAAGRLGRPAWEGMREVELERENALRSETARARRSVGLQELPDDITAAWRSGALPVHLRRGLIAFVVDQVLIHPGKRGAAADPAQRVEIRWAR